MKTTKVLIAVAALSVSSLAMAEGGGDRTFARMEQSHQASEKAYQLAKQQKLEAPVTDGQAKKAEHANC